VNEERVTAGTEHLQTAALEVISAMRAFLDVAEDVVTDNERLDDLSRIVGSVAQGVSNATGFPVPGARPNESSASPSGADAAAGSESSGPSSGSSSGPDAVHRPSGVEHIRVS
jgi:hypothetical protein